jgi:hypothetical protein
MAEETQDNDLDELTAKLLHAVERADRRASSHMQSKTEARGFSIRAVLVEHRRQKKAERIVGRPPDEADEQDGFGD